MGNKKLIKDNKPLNQGQKRGERKTILKQHLYNYSQTEKTTAFPFNWSANNPQKTREFL